MVCLGHQPYYYVQQLPGRNQSQGKGLIQPFPQCFVPKSQIDILGQFEIIRPTLQLVVKRFYVTMCRLLTRLSGRQPSYIPGLLPSLTAGWGRLIESQVFPVFDRIISHRSVSPKKLSTSNGRSIKGEVWSESKYLSIGGQAGWLAQVLPSTPAYWRVKRWSQDSLSMSFLSSVLQIWAYKFVQTISWSNNYI